MKREYGLDTIQRRDDSVITVGTFDGVHKGHQALLDYVLERARRAGGQSVVLSFDPHPREVLSGKPMPLLTTIEERAALLEDYGLDRFVVLPFTRDFSRLSPRAYVEKILVLGIGVREIVVGHDHSFGRGGEGNSALLQELGEEWGFSVDIIPAQLAERTVISSTRIRECLLNEGAVRQAAGLLGRPYHLRGEVVEGDRRGRTIGFPTANLEVSDERKIIPLDGVYAVRVRLLGENSPGETLPGMMNIGRRPTFDGTRRVPEVHLLDFAGDLYGSELEVAFIERLRDEKAFDGPEALVQQLRRDRAATHALFETGDDS